MTVNERGNGNVQIFITNALNGTVTCLDAPTPSDAINPDPNQPSEIVEFTTGGRFVKEISMDPQPGGAFGLAVVTAGRTARLAAVDDAANTLVIWTLPR
jgi:hypothetical protein